MENIDDNNPRLTVGTASRRMYDINWIRSFVEILRLHDVVSFVFGSLKPLNEFQRVGHSPVRTLPRSRRIPLGDGGGNVPCHQIIVDCRHIVKFQVPHGIVGNRDDTEPFGHATPEGAGKPYRRTVPRSETSKEGPS